MKIENKVKSLLLIVAALVAIEPLLSAPAIAKSCNAASAQGRGGLNCGPAPVTSNSQATGQVVGTKPGQVGAPTIGTSNQNPSNKPPVTTVPALSKAPIEGPKPPPLQSQLPAPNRSPDTPPDAPAPIGRVIEPVAPPKDVQFVPPIVPHPVPMVIPPLVPQQTPMLIPPQIPQQVPVAVPPLVPQPTPMVVPPLVPQQTPMLVPPQIPQQVPVAIPPLAPQPIPVPVPVAMKVPPQPTAPVSPKLVVPPSTPQTLSGSNAPAPTAYVTPRPKPIFSAESRNRADTVSAGEPRSQPTLVVTSAAASANRNEKMITVEPGRQAANNYPTFNVDSATPNRVCVVSGVERRKTVQSNGSATYQGTLPTFRMIATEVADLPAWHPIDSGCVVSITHKR